MYIASFVAFHKSQTFFQSLHGAHFRVVQKQIIGKTEKGCQNNTYQTAY